MVHDPVFQRTAYVKIVLVLLAVWFVIWAVMPRFGRGDARAHATRIQIRALKDALEIFKKRAGRFPTTREGLTALVIKPTGLTDDEWEKVMNEVPKDAWKQEFSFKCPGKDGRDFDLVSKGRDKLPNTADDLTYFSRE